MLTRTLAIVVAAAALAACGTDTDSSSAGLAEAHEQAVETIGDTTVVRTLSGSVWGTEATLVPEVSVGDLDGPEEYLFGSIGSIAVDNNRRVYALDYQAQHVRVFDSTGTYVETLGRRGEGPGEFFRTNAIAVLPDGRLLVRELRDGRVHVFVPGTRESELWTYQHGYYAVRKPLYTDRNGRAFLMGSKSSREADGPTTHVVVMGPDGTPLGTLPVPSNSFERPELMATRTMEGGMYAMIFESVPFTPDFFWAIHPSGRFLTGFSTEYRLDLARDDGVLRIEREVAPVPVSDAEHSHHRDHLERSMRDIEPGWNWDGPPIPEHKPFFTGVHVGRDGRIWVRLSTEGRRVENEDHDPDDPGSEPVSWEEATRFDVFEADGTYLGAVVAPDDFRSPPEPVFDGDFVWAVTRDELDVERVVRYRIVVGGG